MSSNYLNAFTALINNNGEFESINTYPSSSPYYITEAVKLNSELINLLGLNGIENTNVSSTLDNKISYKLIDVTGKEIYSYWIH